jgi:hypothetical protein
LEVQTKKYTNSNKKLGNLNKNYEILNNLEMKTLESKKKKIIFVENN